MVNGRLHLLRQNLLLHIILLVEELHRQQFNLLPLLCLRIFRGQHGLLPSDQISLNCWLLNVRRSHDASSLSGGRVGDDSLPHVGGSTINRAALGLLASSLGHFVNVNRLYGLLIVGLWTRHRANFRALLFLL